MSNFVVSGGRGGGGGGPLMVVVASSAGGGDALTSEGWILPQSFAQPAHLHQSQCLLSLHHDSHLYVLTSLSLLLEQVSPSL